MNIAQEEKSSAVLFLPLIHLGVSTNYLPTKGISYVSERKEKKKHGIHADVKISR